MKGLKIGMCQMKVVPGNPRVNADYIIGEIISASKRGNDIIVFPELCVPGYLIGDKWEMDGFIKDCLDQNERIRRATECGITAIFGSINVDALRVNEDGRMRKMNSVLIANDGEWLAWTLKTLQPNYRIFDDTRHFFSTRQLIDEFNEKNQSEPRKIVRDFLEPFIIPTKVGPVNSGIILCEDMWDVDYPQSPARDLVKNGAEIIFNLSASPWSWQKNRKRHQVVRDLLTDCKVPLVYVNNTGVQNNGKNIITFDGSSTVYDASGEINFEFEPYRSGTEDIVIGEKKNELITKKVDDVSELFSALECAGRGMLEMLPERMRNVFIGVSGGIDSALAAVFYCYLLGTDKVSLIFMPSDYSSKKSENLAKELANNLGIELRIISIQGIVDAIALATGVKKDTLAYQNIQAKARMEILAAKAQERGGVYSANFNKVEAAFGYGTLYGDMAGFLALFGDLLKREIHQIGRYLNEVVYKREVIPEEIFTRKPTAELANNQEDPFDYGDAYRYGYHDQMVRAFVEFRKDLTWFLENYTFGTLEKELKLEEGLLKKLFPKDMDFLDDLEKNWQRFHSAVFKRLQAPPIAIVSKRSFGYDLRESMICPYLTDRYWLLKHCLIG